MASIDVCDWPGCMATLPALHDRLEVRFAPYALDARLANMRTPIEERELVEPDPEDVRKDLCREHAKAVNDHLSYLFEAAVE